MTEEEKLYVEKCDCKEIQKRWKPKIGDMYFDKRSEKFKYVSDNDLNWFEDMLTVEEVEEMDKVFMNYKFLPSLEQLIEMSGNYSWSIELFGHNEKEKIWQVKARKIWHSDGSSPRLACIKAVKEILKEEDSDG